METRWLHVRDERDVRVRRLRKLDIACSTVSVMLVVAICIVILSISRMPAACDVYCASWPLVEGPALVLIPVLGTTLLALSIVNLAVHGVRRPLPWILLLLPLLVAVFMTLVIV